jgi:U3 small nucleolar RNA-associated protein 25
MRSLFHKHCFNLEGKVRLEKNDFQGVLGYIKPGVKQVFERFDVDNRKGLGGDAAVEEVDQRLDWFVKKVSPAERQQCCVVLNGS